MKSLIRQLGRALLPRELRLRLRHFWNYHDYLILPKADLEYAEDNLYTIHTAPFLQDESFQRAWTLGAATGSWHGLFIRWRVHVACWAAQHAAQLPGDFVECGVNRGGMARAMVDYIDFGRLEKRFFLVDTFSGLVPEYLSEEERQKDLLNLYSYYQNNAKEEVMETFASFANVQVIQGAVPDVLPEIPAEKVAYVSLDMNCTLPEIKAAEHFWERMVPGGILLLDDYAQKLHSEQQAAFDNFAQQRGVGVLTLPTGQGLMVKN